MHHHVAKGPTNRTRQPAAEPDFLARKVDWYQSEKIDGTWGGRHILDGRTPDHDAIVLMSNDYLSLANHPEILRTQIDTLSASEDTMLMSSVFLQQGDPQLEFEHKMSRWMGYEAGILCQSGYAANVGLIQAMGETSMPAYVDMFAHASLWEGVTSAHMTPRPFRHNDPRHLENQIKRHGQGMVIIDSIYSSLGDIAKLEEIVEIAERHDCLIIVDESHSLGSHGPNGRGLIHAHDLISRVHFVTASLAKTFAGRAGFIACSERLQQYFKFHALPNIFSSAMLPHEIAALDKTLELIHNADDRRRRLHDNAHYLRTQLDRLGYNVDQSESQIIPLEAGAEPQTMILRDALEARGVFGAVFYSPATPAKRSMVRLSVNASLTDDQLARIIEVCRDIREEVELAEWPSTHRKQKRRRSA